jgi:hypothetical protein
MSGLRRWFSRLTTVRALFAHFASRGRFVLVPMLLVLVLGSLLLLATEGVGLVAPFVYSLF